MSEATTPANTTDQIAATTATRGDIASHEGDATTPTVVQDAQQYDWRKDLDSIEACEEVWECADGCCTNFMPRHNDECIRLAAYIESLEAERDALRAEHEAWGAWVDAEHAASKIPSDEEWRELHRLEEAHQVAHDNAERVIHGE